MQSACMHGYAPAFYLDCLIGCTHVRYAYLHILGSSSMWCMLWQVRAQYARYTDGAGTPSTAGQLCKSPRTHEYTYNKITTHFIYARGSCSSARPSAFGWGEGIEREGTTTLPCDPQCSTQGLLKHARGEINCRHYRHHCMCKVALNHSRAIVPMRQGQLTTHA